MVNTAGAGSCRGSERKPLRFWPSAALIVMRRGASVSTMAERTPLEMARTERPERADKAARREIGTMADSLQGRRTVLTIGGMLSSATEVRWRQSLEVNVGCGTHNRCGKTHNSPQVAHRFFSDVARGALDGLWDGNRPYWLAGT